MNIHFTQFHMGYINQEVQFVDNKRTIELQHFHFWEMLHMVSYTV